MTSRVVRVPHEHTRDAGVQTDGHETGHCKSSLSRSDVRDGSIACDGDWQGEEHDDTSELQAVREKGDSDCEGETIRPTGVATYGNIKSFLPVTGVATA